MSVDDALNHKYMQDFRSTEKEIILPEMITIPFNDNAKQSIKQYRDALYYRINDVDGSDMFT